jgi:hypothetical protein
MQLSKYQGEEKAIQLASAYLAERMGGVWQCQCASIDLVSAASDRHFSESHRKFSIAVNCVQKQLTGDNQVTLLVDIARQSVKEL